MYSSFVQFVRSLYNKPEGSVYLHEPRFYGNERKYVLDAIDSTFVSSVGAYVNLFEQKMCEITGAKYAVAVVNGTAALHISLLLAGVASEEEVLTQPLTFVATANAISYQKAIPHFIDVDEDTMGLSPKALQRRLEEIGVIKNNQCYNKETGRRISACLPMHTFGFASRIDEIVAICDQYAIPVVEDAAESLGSTYKNKATGTFGLLGTYSFNGNKTVTAGGGGALVTNDEQIAKRAKHITTTAKIPHRWEYVHDQIAYNYRMPNLNAALACAQLEQLPSYLKNKQETAEKYQHFFKEVKGISSMIAPSNSTSNYWLNAIRLSDRAARDAFLQYSNDNRIMTRPIWKLINKLAMYQDCPKGDLSIAQALEDTIVNIPSSIRI